MPDRNITWLASYPKSGNTWFRAVLSNLRSGLCKPVQLNDLQFDVINSSGKKQFQDVFGTDPSDFSQSERDELRAQLFSFWNTNSDGRIFVKTHDSFRQLASGAPLISDHVTHAALYFVRNPLDVVASFANHEVCSLDEMIDFMIDDDAIFADEHVRGHTQVPQLLSSWNSHVSSWAESGNDKILCVRYEDMYTDPETTFANAMRHIGVDFDNKSLNRALDNSSFATLSKQGE